jgi:hypothetical protein
MNYYKIKVKKIKKVIVYYLLLLLIVFNVTIYSVIGYRDFEYSNKINYSYKNLLKLKTKKILSKNIKDITIKEFLKDIVQNEYNVYFIYPLFIKFLANKNIKLEIKNNLILYSIDILKKIKPSSLFLDFNIYIYTLWEYPREEIVEMIKKSLEIDNDLSNHKVLFSKNMIDKYSGDIIDFYKPKTLSESSSYFNYLIRTTHYKEIIDYINNNKINIDIRTVDKNIASNIIKIGDFEKSKLIIKDLIKKQKIDYLFYYLSILYKNNNDIESSIKTLEEMKKIPEYNKIYMTYLAEEYYLKKEYLKAIDTLFNTNNIILKRYCYKYIAYVYKLPIEKQGKYFEKVKYTCDKKQIYSVLSNYYKKIGNIDKYDLYNLEINIMK